MLHPVDTHRDKERAVLIGIVLPGMTRREEEESLDELAFLADTAGAEVVHTLLQERHAVDPATLIGSGKVREISRIVQEENVQVVIVDTDLSPVQAKNLEKIWNRKVVDRSGLILDIFAGRARTREAQLQVELAQLEYYLPRLTRQWTHLSRQVGGIGTRGPGETQLEVDRREIRKRIAHLKDQLGKVERQRAVRRKNRQSFLKVALVGYTNAGKSSLMNALAHADVFVENRLFATLDATIRAISVTPGKEALLIDTVGFIRKLPHDLVASFRSTLEETAEADILLHVVDISHPQYEEQIGSVQEVLRELKLHHKPVIMVFNKVDRVADRRLLERQGRRYDPVVFTSATRGIGLESLKAAILSQYETLETEEEIRIPADRTRLIARIHELARVLETRFEDSTAVIRYRAREDGLRRIHALKDTENGDADINHR